MYHHKEIEKKWQDFWEKNKTFKTENISKKPKFYVLDMFPYPSGAGLHVGHPEGFTANDIVARYKNANGYNVLHPMGWDAFGLPAENYAIKTGTHPKITTEKNIETFKRQIKALGFSYDWDREINTTDPKYFKWTQWIFLKMFEAGLAYEQDLPINYCPSCKTGLANEEVLSDNTCDRCGNTVEKRKIRQWVLAITKYADRLEKDVDKLDWPKGIKDMQKNWIGRSEGCEFELKKADDENKSIRVYTTRIDTVFSMAFVVIAPDHTKVMDFITEEQKEVCLNYINKSKNESEQERTNEGKEKTGVFTGSYVVNPYNNEKVPLWIGDFVLGNYGTGAVFGDIHDERDYVFAQKYGIPLKQSIAPAFEGWSNGEGKPKKDIETLITKGIGSVLLNQKGDKVLIINWCHSGKWKSFVTGRTEDGENIFESAIRELKEETGYVNFKYLGKELIRKTHNYHPGKNVNFSSLSHGYLFQLESDEQVEISEEELSKHTLEWVDIKDVKNLLSFDDHKILVENFFEEKVITQDGILVNSGEFDGLTSSEARIKLTEYAEKKGFGEKRVNYKLRDWLFSRQRYWGEPIPLIHLEKDDFDKLPRISDMSEVMEENKAYVFDKKGTSKRCKNCTCGDEGCTKLIINGKSISKVYNGLYTKIICDYKLPLELPEVEKYEPAGDGQSPLANVENFVNVKLADNLNGKRETNTMPQWGGSCWYYLRFMDNKNTEELVNNEVEKYWGQVDSYVGGAEHAVLHLLYARFWHKFLFDIGVVSSDEPFHRLRNQGLVLAYAYQRDNGGLIPNDEVEEKNGKFFEKTTGSEVKQIVSKMSKSLKNVVNPDDIINEYGADALRLYEMYMSDFKDSAPWDTKNIVGVSRFLDKVWNIFEESRFSKENDNFTMKLLNKAIKKVGEDIEEYKFNTAIAQMMILVNNGLPKDEKLQIEWKEKLLIILNPFAPHITEELWQKLGNNNSIFLTNWPKYDENLVKDDVIIIGVQVLGKLRGEIEIGVDEEQSSVLEKAKANENVAKWIEGKEILKEIYVKGKIVNLVVK